MNATPCRFFRSAKGCFRGDTCSYLHTREESDQNSPVENEADGSQNGYNGGNHYANGVMGGDVRANMGMKGTPCRFYLSGAGCRNGNACPFLHMNTMGNEMMHPGSAPPMAFNGYYLSGGDENGSTEYYGGGVVASPEMNAAPFPTPTVQTTQSYPQQPPPAPVAPNRRHQAPPRRLQIHSNPSKKKHEVISEITPVLTRDIEGPFFAIDVECVATGRGNADRDVARIAVVDEDENVFFDEYVKPDKAIVSYLTQLTGITESDLVDAPNLADSLVRLRAILPKDSVIVGQSIKKDLDWLGLEKGQDFRQMFDVADLFRIPMQMNNGTIRYRAFSLRHVAKHLLGQDIQEADHDPVIDAKYAMKIFKQFRHLHETPAHRDAVYQTLLKTPRTPSFAERFPVIDGVEMRAPRKQIASPPLRDSSGAEAGSQ